MAASHPLDSLSPKGLKQLFVVSLLVTLGMSLLFAVWGQALVHQGAPLGILSFEFVWNLNGVERVMGPWDEATRRTALHINLVDFLYMVVYSTTLAAAALLIKRKAITMGITKLGQVSLLVAWLAWIAAGFDAIENLASLPLLLGTPSMPWPFIMSAAAFLKFVILFEVIVFIVFITFFLTIVARRVK